MRKAHFFLYGGICLCACAVLIVWGAPLRPVLIGSSFVIVETARTPHARAKGLQGRAHLDADRGMLFYFEETDRHAFWTKNTFIPLDIAFIDEKKVIIDIQEMIPLDTSVRYIPREPARYALEVNAGWFAKHRIRPGKKAYFW